MAALLQHRVQGIRTLLKRQVALRLDTDVNIMLYDCIPFFHTELCPLRSAIQLFHAFLGPHSGELYLQLKHMLLH